MRINWKRGTNGVDPAPQKLGLLLLGIWLIITGLRQTKWSRFLTGQGILASIIAGIVIILDR